MWGMTQHAKGRANQDCWFTSFCCFELVCGKDGMMRMVRYKVFSNIEGKVNIEEPLNNHLGEVCNILYPTNAYVEAWHLIFSMLSFSLEASCAFATCHPFNHWGYRYCNTEGKHCRLLAQHQSSAIAAISISFSLKTALNCAYPEILISRDSPFLHPFLHGNLCFEGGPIAFSALGLISVCHLMWICQWVYNKLAKYIFHASSNPPQSWVMNACTTLHC
jgi:hypothetical protein